MLVYVYHKPRMSESHSTPHLSTKRNHNYDQIILFGDSITQQSESQDSGFGFGPALRNEYIRKLDVVNRGFSGYTGPLALHVLPQFMPTPSQANVRLLVVFFGANDACLPGEKQHVPLDKYEESLKSIISHEVVKQHGGCKILLITSGPVDEWQMDNSQSTDDSSLHRQRTAENTRVYAEACRKVAREMRVGCVDLWNVFMKAAGWREGDRLVGSRRVERSKILGELLKDGM